MMKFLNWAKGFLDCNLTTLAAGFFILFVLLGVPQIRTIWLQLPYQLIWTNDRATDKLLGSLFILLVVFLIVTYTAAWYAVIPIKYLLINGLPTLVGSPTARLQRRHVFRPRHWLAWLFVPVYVIAALPNWLADKVSKKGRWWIAVILLVVTVANFITRQALDFPTADAQQLFPYPLAGSTCSLFGWLLVPWVLWWAYSAIWGPDPRKPFGRTWTMLGRIFVQLFVTTCVGEALWIGAYAMPSVLSYRVYTIWAVFHLAFDVAVIAITLDVSHWRFSWPVRPIALLTGVLLLVFCPNFWPTFQPTSGSTERFEETPSQTDWYDHLYRRILETDERAPVVFVASSGGGSRAALFTSLVLEALANEPLTNASNQPAYGDLRWGDQIVLMSSVSGGSLGNGYYAHRLTQPNPEKQRPSIRNSFATGLSAQTDTEYDRVFKTYYQPLWEEYADEAEQSSNKDTKKWGNEIRQAIAQQVKPTSDQFFPTRYLQSAFADDMCTDFMAPLGRGFMTPEMERGRALAVFWDQRFRWGGVTNRGFPYGEQSGRRPPLLLFNATEVSGGRRLVVGFPPLYPNTFRPPPPSHPLTAGQFQQTVALEDFSPTFELRLSEAIRLSANFPWGIPPATLKRTLRTLKPNLDANSLKKVRDRLTAADSPGLATPILKALYPEEVEQVSLLRDDVSLDKQREDLDDLLEWLAQFRFDGRVPLPYRQWANSVINDLETKEHVLVATTDKELVLDGGVNDNTGIPTICELLEHLQRVAAAYGSDSPSEFLTATRANTAWLILHELQRRGVVLVEIDSGAKPSPDPIRVLQTLRIPIQGLENAGYDNSLGAKDDYLTRIQNAVRPFRSQSSTGDRQKSETIIAASPMLHIPFVCNHSTDEDVMTAWALPPLDKAKIYATFFCELREWQQVKQPWFRQSWLWAWEYRKAKPPRESENTDWLLNVNPDPDGPPIMAFRRRPDLPADAAAPQQGNVAPQLNMARSLDEAKRAIFQNK